MTRIDTRELEYFIAAAEELHFGRAAARLSVAQPAVSKTIRQVESRLGFALFVRSSRQVSLTPSGEELLHHGRRALEAVDAAVERARRAGEAQAALRLVIKPGGDANLLSGILAVYGRRPDARRVEVLFSGTIDRADYLRDGRADVGLLYAPFDDLTGLSCERLFSEGRVALLPPGHCLADRGELRVADLEHEPVPRWKGRSGEGSGPEVADIPQLVQMIMLGRTIAVLPRSLAEAAHPALTLVPVVDAPASHLVVARSQHDHRPLVRSFIAAALEAKTQQAEQSSWRAELTGSVT